MRPVPRVSRAILIVLAIAMMPMARAVRADALYQVTNLGDVNTFGLTNSGQVLNATQLPTRVVVYNSYGPNAGQQTAMPLIGGVINNNGIIAGTTYTEEWHASPVNVLVNPNSPTGNQTPIPTSLPSTAGSPLWTANIYGINDSNQVVGVAPTPTGDQHAFLSSGGTVTDLGTFGGPTSTATAINDGGQVVGAADVASGVSHAFLYSAGKMIDLGVLPGSSSSTATAINASGEVVGYSGLHTSSAFLYHDGTMTNLGSLPGQTYSQALGINSQGTIVGTSGWNAFIDQKGVMTDLNSLIPANSNFHLNMANYINDQGQIIAWGTDARGVRIEYLLTPAGMPAPTPPVLTDSEVPEPSVLAFGALLASLAGARWGIARLGRGRRQAAA